MSDIAASAGTAASPGRSAAPAAVSPGAVAAATVSPGRAAPGTTAPRTAVSAGAQTRRGPRGLITDWGGVLTVPIAAAVTAWLKADGIDLPNYRSVMTRWIGDAYGAATAVNPVHALERGEIAPEEFETLLAAQLVRTDGRTVPAPGLLRRMFAGMSPVEPMYALVRCARAAGIATGLLSNSWGNDYPRDAFAGLFDAVVISSEVGMRKPEEGIFLHALARLGLAAGQCVFIDDIEANVAAAEALGMVGVHHRDPGTTAAAVTELLGLSL